MKKQVYSFLLCLFTGLKILSQATVTITNLSGTFTLTCKTPTINLQAASSITSNATYVWFSSPTSSVTGNPKAFTSPGNYTVVVTETITNVTASQTFAIAQNTTAPTSSLTSLTASVNCNTSPVANFTATAISPTTNIEHEWYAPQVPYPTGPISGLGTSQTDIYSAVSGPGVYYHNLIDLSNGCSTNKTFTVYSLSGYTSFGVSSSNNFTLGCSPMNQTTLCLINVITNTNTVQFLILSPETNSIFPYPIGAYGTQMCTVTSVPGTWTLAIHDNADNCQTLLPLVIKQNTIAPSISVSMVSQTLSCFNPTLQGIAFSSTSNTEIFWKQPTAPPIVYNSTVFIGPIPTQPVGQPPSFYTYTAVATNTLNSCKTTTTVNIYMNFKFPESSSAVYTTACTGTVQIANGSTLSPGNYSFSWTPLGSSGNIIGPTNTQSVIVNGGGAFQCITMNAASGCSRTDTIYVHTCVGLKENYSNALNAKIFPNPAKNYLMIDLPEMPEQIKLEVYDAQGKVVVSEMLHERSNKINFNLAKGFYLYRVSEKGVGVKNGKLIVE